MIKKNDKFLNMPIVKNVFILSHIIYGPTNYYRCI